MHNAALKSSVTLRMIPIVNAEGSRTIDQRSIAQDGKTSLFLMEQAVASAASVIRTIIGPERQSILVLCGQGNNGGDGFGIAAALAGEHSVVVRWIGDPGRRSAETSVMMQRAQLVCEVAPYHDDDPLPAADVVIDALIGVGCTPPLAAPVVSVLTAVNAMQAIKIAIDVPTGLDASTGLADVHTFRAAHTITMAAEKIGQWRNDGPRLCGSVHVVQIGAPPATVNACATAWRFERDDVRTLLPRRTQPASKFSYGRVVVIAGSRSMRGAAALTAHAALVAGAGLVELISSGLHPLIPREVITHQVPTTVQGTISPDARSIIMERIAQATVVAVGPGLGTDETTLAFLADVLREVPLSVPIILDADGLRCAPALIGHGHTVILTPHVGEFARLVGRSREQLQPMVMESALHYAREHACIVHAKDVPSITTDGTTTFLTVNGNPGMATAGAGDVLTGIIAALCAQDVPALHAAALGSYLHAAAGDRYASLHAMESLTASDLIHTLRDVIPQ
jgi:NAD(P)H-hydrate epimerase